MKLTKKERKIHHKLRKWQYRHELSSPELKIVAALRDQVGENNVSINLQEIATVNSDSIFYLFESISIEHLEADASELNNLACQEIVRGFEKLQERGFIRVVRSKDWKEHIVNVIPVWEKNNID